MVSYFENQPLLKGDLQMKISNRDLANLIQDFLSPVPYSRKAKQIWTRKFITALQIMPNEIGGRPNMPRIKDIIKLQLSSLLIEASGVRSGEVLTYFTFMGYFGPYPSGFAPAKICTVEKVSDHYLSMKWSDGHVQRMQIPLYCKELLDRIGAVFDFTAINRI